MGIYNVAGNALTHAYNVGGETSAYAYDVQGTKVFPDDIEPLPVPTGTLTADEIIPLPDIYEEGKGFTCTGLAYDATNNHYLIGDIGILKPNSGTIQSQIVIVDDEFSSVISTIPVYQSFANMGGIQGIAIDTSDNTIWFCAPSENTVHHIGFDGTSIGSFTVNRCTGIAYDALTDSLWIITYNQQIINVSKAGTTISSYTWDSTDTMDQCFIDAARRVLYFDAGDNYSQQNYLYAYDITNQSASVACTLTDSFSVEGICINPDKLIIVNDGYYHNAATPTNQANVYLLS